MYLGVKAVIAKSIERIHQANLVNFGIAPLLFENPSDYDLIEQGDEIEIPDIRKAVESGAEDVVAKDVTKNKEFKLKIYLTDRQRRIILEGGLLPYTAKGGRS